MIEQVSCIRFQTQTEVNHKDYIEFRSGRGCMSQVGRSGKETILCSPYFLLKIIRSQFCQIWILF